ncbi:DUF418 domain-containing protein [Pyxidicoccus fallax]|uniref:DUF418 domain-containing protein n=1 Tax=Pyxidicoccus fallax TaxID=394095 RepID=A0A848LMU6_9BACT|nr:DUF418 domain-containing protein [Pyxidicoccus fallax]NMO19056.1 DUF418 domain-containing protein [Pyxidicoccus fallax]NPC82115.1 DUF418 domain-containing protein [Pyxidicoccus fallax]
MTPAPSAAPIDSSERLALLDTLRGFALCGVFISNVFMWFSGRAFLPRARLEAWMESASLLDKAVLQFYSSMVSGKFITIFSFLFGLGFAVQLGRAEARGASIVPVYSRRLVVMLLMGLTHLFLLWYGDILSTYAVLGFGLLLLRKRSDRTLLILTALLVLVWPVIGTTLLRLPQLLAETPEAAAALAKAASERSGAIKAEALAAFSDGNWWRVVKAGSNFYLRDFIPMILATMLATFGRFVLGLVAGRRRIFHDAPQHLGLFRRLLVWGLVAGVIGSGTGLVFQQLMLRKILSPDTLPVWVPIALAPMRHVGELGFAAVYVSGLTLLFQRATWQRVLGVLAPVGRMALTNYLSQTVISLFIFYGYGLGLITKVGPVGVFALCLPIFAVQVVFSHLWLSRFRFGPAEWVWRSLTYGKAQPMRRDDRPGQQAPVAA